jgi:hypothetical protein
LQTVLLLLLFKLSFKFRFIKLEISITSSKSWSKKLKYYLLRLLLVIDLIWDEPTKIFEYHGKIIKTILTFTSFWIRVIIDSKYFFLSETAFDLFYYRPYYKHFKRSQCSRIVFPILLEAAHENARHRQLSCHLYTH